ncbi:TraI/MobA(P) family conjugative relaxase [Paraburkholderia sp. J10-1]|uniref:TraI/MobA(P) family conjugative relaxase n=1 Tax=Paraburkholderia sp. J10-1 TaxID=2805430 RepID=UPI002AB707AA|nr:TraI/MobA(P) family conjugative relaxase [Paraburkholderia sp. J10-1]
MIGKKVKNPRKSASKATRIYTLVAYVRCPETKGGSEKCSYAGARGFLTDAPESQTAEMLALSQEAVRSADTISHYVLSWQEGEHPSPEQVEEAVGLFMDKLGLKGHQVIYALHTDTDNIHLHLVVNRVHPDHLKVIKPNRGFDIEAVHEAVAIIENRQGWRREHNGRYQVLAEGVRRTRPDSDRRQQPDQLSCGMEHRTGEKSAERIAIEEAAPIIRRATGWQDLHQQLADLGMRYEKTGSGATLFVGDIGVKASRADRSASLIQLQKRLGAYEPSSELQQIAARVPLPVTADEPGWERYIADRKAHHAARVAAMALQKQRQDAERMQLAGRQKVRREATLKGDWKGWGALRNAAQSMLAAEQAAEKAALKERHKRERQRLRDQYRPFPDLAVWQTQYGLRDSVNQRWQSAGKIPRIEGDESESPTPRDIRAYVPEVHGQQVHYIRIGTGELAGRAAFVDKGREIDIHDWRDYDSLLAALQLAAQKWGSFRVIGNDEYKTMCVRLAAEHGFRVSNPELAERIRQERLWIRRERVLETTSVQLQQVEADGPGTG